MGSRVSTQHNCDHYNGERHPHLRKRKFGDQEVDAVIVGLGAAGECSFMSWPVRVCLWWGSRLGLFGIPKPISPAMSCTPNPLAWNDTRLSAGHDAPPVWRQQLRAGGRRRHGAFHRGVLPLPRKRFYDADPGWSRGGLAHHLRGSRTLLFQD